MVRSNLEKINMSGIAKIVEIANKMGSDLIRLEMGDVDLTTPIFIAEEVVNATKQNFTHYTPFSGYNDLKKAIADKLKRDNNVSTNTDNVLVTSGASTALFIAMYSLLDSGDEIIVPDPFWSNVDGMTKLVGVKIKTLPMNKRNKIDLNELENIVNKNTKALLINTPHNPTGSVFDKKLLEGIAQIAERHKLVVISDEEYEKFVYDKNKHFSIGSIYEDTVTIQSFSKTYAMCGWRIGYLAAKEDLVKEMTKVNLFTNICAPSICQRAALKALNSDQIFTKNMVKEFEERRDVFVRRLDKIKGIKCELPEGSVYVWPNVSELNNSSIETAKFLIKKAKVTSVPGSVFGKNGEGHLRFSLGAPLSTLEEAAERIEKAIVG